MTLRFWRTLIFFGLLAARLIFWHIILRRIAGREFVRRGQHKRWQAYTRGFRGFAIDMGGVMIKLGQFISTRVDLLPPEITATLADLQDEVPAVPFEQIRAIIERDLGPGATRFQWIDATPVAAASLGQAHRAQLLSGERVVVKVLRPGIEEIVANDLAAMHIVARVLMKYPPIARRMDAVALIAEFGRVLAEELSYEQEAQNAGRFGKMFHDDMGVYIPAVYEAHSTDCVLVMEDVTAIKISDHRALEAAGISRRMVAERLLEAYIKQIFEERFFHADPHPGNLFVYPLPIEDESAYTPETRPFYLIFVDFGMTGALTEQIATGLANTFAGLVNRDAERVIQSYADLGLLLPDADIPRLIIATRASFDQVWGMNLSEISAVGYSNMLTVVDEFKDLFYSLPFQMPQDFVYLGRAIGIVTGMSTELAPEYDPWRKLSPAVQRLAAQSVETGLPPELNALAADLLATFPVLGRILRHESARPFLDLSRRIMTNLFATPQPTANETARLLETQINRSATHNRRAVRAIVFGSVLIAATLLYTNGDTTVAAVGYAISGLGLLVTLLRGSYGD